MIVSYAIILYGEIWLVFCWVNLKLFVTSRLDFLVLNPSVIDQ
jgi:hypothetical protein